MEPPPVYREHVRLLTMIVATTPKQLIKPIFTLTHLRVLLLVSVNKETGIIGRY